MHTADSLGEALDLLEADETLVDAVGRPLIENYLAVKRDEIAELDGKTEAQIIDYYLPFI